jgi:hypothetical protein
VTASQLPSVANSSFLISLFQHNSTTHLPNIHRRPFTDLQRYTRPWSSSRLTWHIIDKSVPDQNPDNEPLAFDIWLCFMSLNPTRLKFAELRQRSNGQHPSSGLFSSGSDLRIHARRHIYSVAFLIGPQSAKIFLTLSTVIIPDSRSSCPGFTASAALSGS